jgi:hypothetical protein
MAYPSNPWLVSKALKHGFMTKRKSKSKSNSGSKTQDRADASRADHKSHADGSHVKDNDQRPYWGTA